MENSFYQQELNMGLDTAFESMGRFTARTFGIMCLGLLITFLTSIWWYASGMVIRVLLTVPSFHLIILVAELAVVIGMTASLHKISAKTALAFFILYAAITGVTFSTYFLIFDAVSLVLVFAGAALYFAGMAVFGYFTRVDLSRVGTLLFGGLIFLIIGNLLMMLLPGLEAADHVLCTAGMLIFLAYTAYDTQKLQALYRSSLGDREMMGKVSVIMALNLYLDFVNLFLYLLRLFGKKKN